MSDDAANPQAVEIERHEEVPREIQIHVHHPLRNVPYWIELQLDPGTRPFRTMPSGHFFESTEGELGIPGELQTIARRLDAGEINQETAEEAINTTLIRWSKASGY